MADWPTIASLAAAAGTLVLAVVTFSSVRAGERSTRIAERSTGSVSESTGYGCVRHAGAVVQVWM
jgi:hypothetical protein